MCSYLFIFSIDIRFLGTDGLADVVDIIFSAVIKDVLVFLPGSDREMERKRKMSQSTLFFSFTIIHIKKKSDD